MQHPLGRCDRCGERLFAHVDGGRVCHNCGLRVQQYVEDESDATSPDEPEDADDDEDGGYRARAPVPRR